MYRSLSELKQSVENMIQEQGENAPCAAFIFTKNDVFSYEYGEDGFPYLDNELKLSDEDTEGVLEEVGDSEYIYEQISEFIDDEVKRIRRKANS
jgi:hypothetical protein